MAAEGLEGTRVSRVKRPAKGKRTVTSWGGANGGAEPVLGNQRKENRALETDPTPPRALGLRNQGPGTSRRGDAGDPGTWVGGWLSICLGSSWTLNSSSNSEQGGAPSPHSPDRRTFSNVGGRQNPRSAGPGPRSRVHDQPARPHAGAGSSHF